MILRRVVYVIKGHGFTSDNVTEVSMLQVIRDMEPHEAVDFILWAGYHEPKQPRLIWRMVQDRVWLEDADNKELRDLYKLCRKVSQAPSHPEASDPALVRLLHACKDKAPVAYSYLTYVIKGLNKPDLVNLVRSMSGPLFSGDSASRAREIQETQTRCIFDWVQKCEEVDCEE